MRQQFFTELYVAFGSQRTDVRIEVLRIVRTPWESAVVHDRAAVYEAMSLGLLFERDVGHPRFGVLRSRTVVQLAKARAGADCLRMIIVFADDQTVSVFPDMSSVRSECEAIDVEQGTYRFFDDLGRRLVPRFISPVSRTSLLFGIKLIGGGNFELDLDTNDHGSAFETSVADVLVIEPNRWFKTIADLARYVADNRRKNNI